VIAHSLCLSADPFDLPRREEASRPRSKSCNHPAKGSAYKAVFRPRLPDARGRPLSFFMTAGQVSDYTGAAAPLDDLPPAQWMLDDRGYDADWYRDALQA